MRIVAHQSEAHDAAAFKKGMRALAHGVTVIAAGAGDNRVGLTATSVISLSTEPPSLLFCVSRTASARAALQPGAAVSVNVLSGTQEDIADRFAGRTGETGAARFSGGPWRQTTAGTPVLDGALANFVCEVEETLDRHSHTIVIARVRETQASEEDCTLVYAHGRYERLGWTTQEARAAVGLAPEIWPLRRASGAALPFNLQKSRA